MKHSILNKGILLLMVGICFSCGKEKLDSSGWTNFTNGSLASGVYSVAIDSNGTKWFNTIHDVVKYNDTAFVEFNSENSGLNCDVIYCIYVDRYNNKWIGTDCGAFKLNYNGNWETVIADTAVKAITGDLQNNIWFGTRGKGLMKVDGIGHTLYTSSNSELESDFISVLSIDNMNNLWIGYESEGGLVSKLTNASFVNYTIPNPNSAVAMGNVVEIVQDIQGYIWVEIPLSGIFKFNGSGWDVFMSGSAVHGLAIDKENCKWVGLQVQYYGGGIYKLDSTNSVNFTTKNSGLLDNWVTSIAIDSKGNKWIGTQKGVSVFKQ